MIVIKRYLPVSLALLFFAFSSAAQQADDILKKMDDVIFAPHDKQATVVITTYKHDEVNKVREAMMKEKGADRKIYRYTKPESQAGIATLSLPGDVMWLKMPAFDKAKRISMLAKSSALNNTDFAWEDVPRYPYAERYDPVLAGTEDDFYILDLIPKSDKSCYSRIVAYIDQTHYYPVRIDYYDRGNKKEKEAIYTYSKVGKYWNSGKVTMTDLKKHTSTCIILTEVVFDQDLPDKLFTPEEFWK